MLRVPVIAIGLRSTNLINRPPMLHRNAAEIRIIFAEKPDLIERFTIFLSLKA